MNRAMSYVTSYWPFFHRDTDSEPPDPSSPAAISPSNSTVSTSSLESSQSLRHSETEEVPQQDESTFPLPYANEWKIFDAIRDRALKPNWMPFPVNWSNNWRQWLYCSALSGPFYRSSLEIHLVRKFDLAFEDVQILMFHIDTEILVFRYQGRFYKYLMRDADLFLYPNKYDSVDAFLKDFVKIKKEEEEMVEPTGTDEQCLDIMHAQEEKVHEMAFLTVDARRDWLRSALVKKLFDDF
ncbi:hypothetical protein C8J56DRAFT_975805 [Mycena floridula]|nr:hypothetical protein C8J56DRAFT_975805 [Mycena floridula]